MSCNFTPLRKIILIPDYKIPSNQECDLRPYILLYATPLHSYFPFHVHLTSLPIFWRTPLVAMVAEVTSGEETEPQRSSWSGKKEEQCPRASAKEEGLATEIRTKGKVKVQTGPVVAAEMVNVGHSLRYRQERRELARGLAIMAVDSHEVELTGTLGESNNHLLS
jgi:hypothetical protein